MKLIWILRFELNFFFWIIFLVLLLYSYFFIFYLLYIFCALFLPFNRFIYIISLYNIRYSSYCSCSFFLNFHLLQSIRYLCSHIDYLFHISFLNCLTSLTPVFSLFFVLFFSSYLYPFFSLSFISRIIILHIISLWKYFSPLIA